MIAEQVDTLINGVPIVQEQGQKVARSIHGAVLSGGDPVRHAVDLLHGTWIGHPLHPVLTDVVVGAWSLGTLFDLISIGDRSGHAEKAADTLTTIGTLSAVPTAVSGLADYSTIPKGAAGMGLTHALLNVLGLIFYLLSLAARRRGQRPQGILFSTLGLMIATMSAYLGGHLVFAKRVGVNHARPATKPKEWHPVLDDGELVEEEPRRIEVEGSPVLLYRHNGRVYAIGAVCPHAGGPLEEGQFDGCRVQCPWHDSVFDLGSGAIIHGPTTYPVAGYETRTQGGKIELRLVHPGT